MQADADGGDMAIELVEQDKEGIEDEQGFEHRELKLLEYSHF